MSPLVITFYTIIAGLLAYTAALGLTHQATLRETGQTHYAIVNAVHEFTGANCRDMSSMTISYNPPGCSTIPIPPGNLACKTTTEIGYIPAHQINLYQAVLTLAEHPGRNVVITLENPTLDNDTARLFNTLINQHTWYPFSINEITYPLDNADPDAGEGTNDLLLVAAGLDNNCFRAGDEIPTGTDDYVINCDEPGTKPWNGTDIRLTGTKFDGKLDTLDLIQESENTLYRGWRHDNYSSALRTHVMPTNPDPCNP